MAYKQVQSMNQKTAAQQVAQQKSARAFVEDEIRAREAEAIQGQFASNPVNDMIDKNFGGIIKILLPPYFPLTLSFLGLKDFKSSFNVGHRDLFTVRREIGFAGTLDELAAKPELLHWKASDAPIPMKEGARAILMSAVIKQTQNSAPVGYSLQAKNLETNSTWTAGNGLQGAGFLKPHMTNPINCEWVLFQRQNVESFDVSSLQGWEAITEEGIRACTIKEHPEVNLSTVVHPSIVTQLIKMKMPEISQDYYQEAQYGVDATTGQPIFLATVNSDLAKAATNFAISLNNQVAFSDPNKIEIIFSRADGQAINSLQGLIDSSPDTGAFQQANVTNQIYHTGLTLELSYLLWSPNSSV